MPCTAIYNPVTKSECPKRKKKKKFSQPKHRNNNMLRWKSKAQQQSYSSKLIQALNQLTITNTSSISASERGRAVREAANRALAVAAKGTTRWSQAILTNRLTLKFRKQKKSHRVLSPSSLSVLATGSSRSKKTRFSVLRLKTGLPTVQRKVRVLGRLVPGCWKQRLPVILDEASDYIAALEMQVRAMTVIAELLSGGGGSTSSSPSTS